MQIYCIRHGQSEANLNNHLIGGRSTQTPLTYLGESQARDLALSLRQTLTFTKLYSSDLVRAIETARIFTDNLKQLINWQIAPELAELSQGNWEGLSRGEVYTDTQLNIINSSGGWFTPPEGESQVTARLRGINWLVENIYHNWNQDEVIAIFAHGTLINNITQFIMGFDPAFTTRLEIANCGYHYFEFDKNLQQFTRVKLCQTS